MFNPFFTTKGTRGTGLGLSVSDSIVQRHRGEFDVWSEKGAGTRIRVWLPVENADHTRGPAAPRPPSVPRGSAAPPEPGKNARILVIDDDDAVLDVLADILRTGEHEVVAARSGEDGLARFKSGWFDLVFTDLGMPGMNGWEVAAGVKALRPGTPVGLITGWGASLDEKRMRDRGVDLIVSKPFRYHDVLALVSEAMQLRERSGS
jgi:CheY-like chemotaxis protein